MTAQPAGEPPAIVTDESRLALAFQRGEDGAYDVIYRRYADMVRRHCERILFDAEDAQDAAQETFLRVYNRLDTFNGRWLLEAWIKRIATNICLDKLRQRNRRAAEPSADGLHGSAFARAAEDPEHVVIRRAEVGGALKKIEALPEMQRDAVVLRDVHDLPHRDIAAVLQITEARARVLIHRAHKTLRGSSPAGILISFWPRMWRRFVRFRAESPDPVAACVYHASTHATEVIDSAGLFFKHGGPVAQSIATVAAAAVVGAGAGIPAANSTSTDFRSFMNNARNSAVVGGSFTANNPEEVSEGERRILAQVTAATTSELEGQVFAEDVKQAEESTGEEPAVETVADVPPAPAVIAAPAVEPGTEAVSPSEAPVAETEPSPTTGEGETATQPDVVADTSTEEPTTEGPTAEEPAAEEPAAEEPVAEKPGAEEPGAEDPVAEEPGTEGPVAEEPVAEEPGAEDPAEDPVAEEPAAEDPVAEEPVAEGPTSEEPVAEGPTSEEPVAEAPSAEVPVAEAPSAEEPVAESDSASPTAPLL